MGAEHALIAVAALLASAVTFFSGFGLGTALLPAFAAFLPIDVAVGMVAIVHLLNNALKFGLLRSHVDRSVFVRFGIPALVFAPIGAIALGSAPVRPIEIVIAVLLVALGLQQLVPRLGRIAFPPKYLSVGGAASGLLGGLAGLQGALRSAFLLRAGLGRESFIATGVAVAVVVDIGRIFVYAVDGTLRPEQHALSLAITGVVASSIGTIVGNRFLKAVTVRGIEIVVGVLLIMVAVALAAGLV